MSGRERLKMQSYRRRIMYFLWNLCYDIDETISRGIAISIRSEFIGDLFVAFADKFLLISDEEMNQQAEEVPSELNFASDESFINFFNKLDESRIPTEDLNGWKDIPNYHLNREK